MTKKPVAVKGVPSRLDKGTEWIGVEEPAAELGVPRRTVYAWRASQTGPRAAMFGKHLRFRRSDLDMWIESRMDQAR